MMGTICFNILESQDVQLMPHDCQVTLLITGIVTGILTLFLMKQQDFAIVCLCGLAVENWKNDLPLALLNRCYLLFRENRIPGIEPLPCNEINVILSAVF